GEGGERQRAAVLEDAGRNRPLPGFGGGFPPRIAGDGPVGLDESAYPAPVGVARAGAARGNVPPGPRGVGRFAERAGAPGGVGEAPFGRRSSVGRAGAGAAAKPESTGAAEAAAGRLGSGADGAASGARTAGRRAAGRAARARNVRSDAASGRRAHFGRHGGRRSGGPLDRHGSQNRSEHSRGAAGPKGSRRLQAAGAVTSRTGPARALSKVFLGVGR